MKVVALAIAEAARREDTSVLAPDGPEMRLIRSQHVARGLARGYAQLKTRESALELKSHSSRRRRQLVIIQRHARAVEKQTQGTEKGPRPRTVREKVNDTAIPPRSFSPGPKRVHLRGAVEQNLGANQREDQEQGEDGGAEATEFRLLASPMASTMQGLRKIPQGPNTKANLKTRSRSLSSDTGIGVGGYGSMEQVVLELQIQKDIGMRERIVAQLHELADSIKTNADELCLLVQKHEALASTTPTNHEGGANVNPFLPPHRRVSLQRVGSNRPESAEVVKDATKREQEQKDCAAQITAMATATRPHIQQFHNLITELQQASLVIVQSVQAWRKLKKPRARFTNHVRLDRFASKQPATANYLLRMNEDLRDLFPSVAVTIILGVDATYNSMLISKAMLKKLGFDSDEHISDTFLTERGSHRSSRSLPAPTLYAARCLIEALDILPESTDINNLGNGISNDQLRACWLALQQERVLEAQDKQRQHEAQPGNTGYNPFENLQQLGGVDAALQHVLTQQAPCVQQLEMSLRVRQENVTRLKDVCSPTPTNNRPEITTSLPPRELHVSSNVLRRQVQQRQLSSRDASSTFEWRSTGANRIGGSCLVRVPHNRPTDHESAMRIQHQFLVHRWRANVLGNLSRFVLHLHHHVTQIQRVFRGHLAKQRCAKLRQQLLARLRHAAALLIWHRYQGFRRQQEKKQRLSMLAAAQFQLMLQRHQDARDKADQETDAVEQYRLVGERRRLERAVLLEKRRHELAVIEEERAHAATKIQSVVRMHAAFRLAENRRYERRAHLNAVSAIMIQSSMRKFLRRQEERRRRFREDLARVNRSVVRIQATFRGYHSRQTLLGQLEVDAPTDCTQDQQEQIVDQDEGVRLPRIASPSASRWSSVEEEDEVEADDVGHAPPRSKSPVRVVLPPLVAAPTRPTLQQRRSSNTDTSIMARTELRLKEAMLGDGLDAARQHQSSRGRSK